MSSAIIDGSSDVDISMPSLPSLRPCLVQLWATLRQQFDLPTCSMRHHVPTLHPKAPAWFKRPFTGFSLFFTEPSCTELILATTLILRKRHVPAIDDWQDMIRILRHSAFCKMANYTICRVLCDNSVNNANFGAISELFKF